METFYVEKLLVPLEKNAFPKRWSANTVTLIGQSSLLSLMIFTWFSQNVTMRDPIPDNYFVMMALALQWFSLNDCMDGMRARRTKCGSPLGRVIDEGIDQIAYACIGGFVGYLLRVEPGFWLLSIGLVNLPFYAMEIRHCYFKDFIMIVGELGPVEIELIYTIIFLLTGLYIGGDGYEKTFAEVTGLTYKFLNFKMKSFIAILTLVLEIIFSYDNLKESIEKDPKKTFRYLIPVFIMLGISYLSSYLPSYT